MKPESHNINSENSVFFPGAHHGTEEQAPLGTGGFDGDMPPEAIIEQTKRNKISSSAMLLVLVIGLAGIGLYSMRSLASAMAGGGADSDLEETIENFLSSMTARPGSAGGGQLTAENAGAVLVDDRIRRQVPLDDVQKNPFEPLPIEQTTDAAPVIIDDGSEAAAVRLATLREEARTEFEEAAVQLRLLMVMGGNEPMANISGRVVRVGDILADERLDVEFRIVEITQGLVVIRGERPAIRFEHDIALRLIRD